ncbi:MAG: hypothetical protein AAF662_14745 [Pseudomonadota bacterium]
MNGVKIQVEATDKSGNTAMRVTYEHFFSEKDKQIAFQEKIIDGVVGVVTTESVAIKDEYKAQMLQSQ